MNKYAEQVLTKIKDRNATIAVIGLGYVGLPLAIVFAEAGHRVIGIDLDVRKVEQLNNCASYIEDIASDRLRPLVTEGRLRATTDSAVLQHCDAVSICVPTPLRKTGDPDISYIVNAADEIARYVHSGMLIVLESTTYPGTTTEVILPKLKENSAKLEVGQDFFLCFSPERVDPGRTDWTTINTPKVMGGVTPDCLAVGRALYQSAIKQVVPVSSTEAAEMVKLLENTFRAVNIGLVNEVLLMCDKLGLDAWEVIEAAATKPFGFMKFTPGPGLGGHCIPIDPLYLSWKLRTLNYTARFIELASEVNTAMPHYWVQKVQDCLNDVGKAVKGSRILVLGVAYKKDVSDVRESPAIDIIHLLQAKGALISYHDPYVPELHYEGLDLRSVKNLASALQVADCTLIVTNHTHYDWRQVQDDARMIVDTRHVIGEND
ncbi:MAG: nucleotide sugar dehydrogenase [Herpetosiphonaceae bacterium]|nr:nucleotide sugar dehydrogenase [Herpetosiphonaceae bacterium]